jgi:hypothetical protein
VPVPIFAATDNALTVATGSNNKDKNAGFGARGTQGRDALATDNSAAKNLRAPPYWNLIFPNRPGFVPSYCGAQV